MELPNSYFAGLFDGEGSVTITKPSASCPRRHRLIAQIAMTHLPTVQKVKDKFGGRIQTVKQSKYNQNATDRYDWRISDTAAAEFIQELQPWLVTKAAAASIALRFADTYIEHKGIKLTDETLTMREALRVELGKENRRGRVRD